MKDLSLNFAFLFQPAGFDIGDAMIAFEASDTYLRAFVVGLINTLTMSFSAGAGAMLLGTLVGVGLVVSNRTSKGALMVFVELMRNLPKLLWLLIIYIVMVNTLPAVEQAWSPLPGVFLSNQGLVLPGFDWESGGLLLAQAGRFGIDGGWEIPMQFVALWLTLTVYHGAQVGEIVRGGLQSISKGQWEAAIALGLPLQLRLRLVILPQVMRRIIPSLISQFINLLKNTSIGLAVGFTDLMSVASTTINQAFKPLEVMVIVMCTYLAIGILLAGLLNGLSNRLRKGQQ